jgi:hypothetical protein
MHLAKEMTHAAVNAMILNMSLHERQTWVMVRQLRDSRTWWNVRRVLGCSCNRISPPHWHREDASIFFIISILCIRRISKKRGASSHYAKCKQQQACARQQSFVWAWVVLKSEKITYLAWTHQGNNPVSMNWI